MISVCFGWKSLDEFPKPYSILQAVDIETYDGSYYLVNSIAHYLGIKAPNKPIFTDSGAARILASPNPEENTKLFKPYKSLQNWMRLIKGVTKKPGPDFIVELPLLEFLLLVPWSKQRNSQSQQRRNSGSVLVWVHWMGFTPTKIDAELSPCAQNFQWTGILAGIPGSEREKLNIPETVQSVMKL